MATLTALLIIVAIIIGVGSLLATVGTLLFCIHTSKLSREEEERYLMK
jgi:protein-S-isoprenylcysteine O-methyltransferase Ste14